MWDWCVFAKLLLLARLCYIKTKHYNLFWFKIIIIANVKEKENKINLTKGGSFWWFILTPSTLPSHVPDPSTLSTPPRSPNPSIERERERERERGRWCARWPVTMLKVAGVSVLDRNPNPPKPPIHSSHSSPSLTWPLQPENLNPWARVVTENRSKAGGWLATPCCGSRSVWAVWDARRGKPKSLTRFDHHWTGDQRQLDDLRRPSRRRKERNRAAWSEGRGGRTGQTGSNSSSPQPKTPVQTRPNSPN